MRFENMSIKQIYELMEQKEKSQDIVSDLLADGRKGLLPLANRIQGQLEEARRFRSLWDQETKYWEQNKTVIGLDEAGRGPLAGPVVAAAVIFKNIPDMPKLKDSKKLSNLVKDELLQKIECQAYQHRVSFVDNNVIDKIDILKATKLAMLNAVKDFNVDVLLIDGNFTIDHTCVQIPIVKGDAKVGSIAAASILAKVYRDRHMLTLHERYPVYNFAKNKGYPTEEHYWALRKYGPSPVHRITFKGVLSSSEGGRYICEE